MLKFQTRSLKHFLSNQICAHLESVATGKGTWGNKHYSTSTPPTIIGEGMISISFRIAIFNFAEARRSDSHFYPSIQSLIYLSVIPSTAIIKNLLISSRNTSFGALFHLFIPDTFHNNKKAISPYLFAFCDGFLYTHWLRCTLWSGEMRARNCEG